MSVHKYSFIQYTHTSLFGLIHQVETGMPVENSLEKVVGIGSFVLGDHVSCSFECYPYYSRVDHLET